RSAERARVEEPRMTDFRRVTDQLSVSPQITPDDVAQAAAQGFVMVINNRPDGEDLAQPTSDQIQAAAQAAGLAYVHIPVRGGPTPDQVEAMRAAAESADGPVLAFCRSGTRSIVTWSVGQALTGAAPRDDLVRQGAAAGYDLSGVLPH
ncbi:MAG: family phosphatase, partial [Caulobacter sp.]|nr:family phosphatase [Caulobacter sp.]